LQKTNTAPKDVELPKSRKAATAKTSRSKTPARAKPEPKNKKGEAGEPLKSKEITKKPQSIAKGRSKTTREKSTDETK